MNEIEASLGIDIGTTAIKMILVSSIGDILGVWSSPHDLLSPQQGFAEEDTTIWEQHLYSLLQTIARDVDVSIIKAIGVTGMVPTLIPLGKSGKPLMHSIQQNDIRSEQEIDELSQLIDPHWFFGKTGNRVNQQHLFPKVFWISRHRPEVYAQICHLMGSYDYISYLLTGTMHVERNWALESGMWDIHNNCWLQDILNLGKVDANWLPPVVDPTDIVGTTTEDIALRTGIPSGIPVVAGTADHVASAFCTGARKSGDLVLKLGGAGDILLATGSLVTDDRMFVDYGCTEFVPYLLNGCTASSGSMLKWFQKEFSFSDFVQMDKEAESISPGSDGVLILPYFLGEKTPIFDVHAKGIIYGLSLSHTKIHVYRAMLEAVAFSFKHHLEVFEALGLPINRVFITNGGSKSTLWRSIMADVVGHDLKYVKDNPGSCLGASFLGGIGAGIMTEKIADAFLQHTIDIPYSPERNELYKGRYQKYKDLYKALKPLFHE